MFNYLLGVDVDVVVYLIRGNLSTAILFFSLFFFLQQTDLADNVYPSASRPAGPCELVDYRSERGADYWAVVLYVPYVRFEPICLYVSTFSWQTSIGSSLTCMCLVKSLRSTVPSASVRTWPRSSLSYGSRISTTSTTLTSLLLRDKNTNFPVVATDGPSRLERSCSFSMSTRD